MRNSLKVLTLISVIALVGIHELSEGRAVLCSKNSEVLPAVPVGILSAPYKPNGGIFNSLQTDIRNGRIAVRVKRLIGGRPRQYDACRMNAASKSGIKIHKWEWMLFPRFWEFKKRLDRNSEGWSVSDICPCNNNDEGFSYLKLCIDSEGDPRARLYKERCHAVSVSGIGGCSGFIDGIAGINVLNPCSGSSVFESVHGVSVRLYPGAQGDKGRSKNSKDRPPLTSAFVVFIGLFLMAYSQKVVGYAVKRTDYLADLLLICAFGVFVSGGFIVLYGVGVFTS